MKKPLYVQKRLINPDPLYTWMEQNGIENPEPKEKLHTTLVFSKTPVLWSKFLLNTSKVRISMQDREIKQLGDMTVLAFKSPFLQERFKYFKNGGCSWDFPEYIPHISLYKGEAKPDLKPFMGDLILGAEEAEDLDLGKGTKVNMEVMSSLNAFMSPMPEDIDKIIEAALKDTFINKVIEAAKPFKIKVSAKNPIENTVTLRYKTLTIIIDPDTITTMFYAKGLEDINAPGFMPMPTPKTKRGMTGAFKHLLSKYDKVVNDAKDLYKESDKVDGLKKKVKLDGVIDRLGISVTDSLKADEELDAT